MIGAIGKVAPFGRSYGFCLRLSAVTGEIVYSCERITAGGMTFGPGLSGIIGNGSGLSGRWRPSGASFGFCLRLLSATGEILLICERGTAGGMTFVSELSGMPGMIRDCREGGALWAQFLDFAFGSYLRQVHFPHMCRSSPHPTRELPGMSLPSSPISICSIIQPLGHFVTASQTWGAFTVCMPGIFDIYPMCLLAFSLICANEADD